MAHLHLPHLPLLAVSAGEAARWAVAAAAVGVTVAVLIWFVAMRQHPENAAGHDDSGSVIDRKPDDVSRRPAGPAAENMNPDPPGGAAPPGDWPGSSAIVSDPPDGGRR
jgi:hypothetical protein